MWWRTYSGWFLRRFIILCAIGLIPTLVKADSILVAAASNFAPVLKQIGEGFEQKTGIKLTISQASSGKHFAQMVHGAPFEIFFSADAYYPKQLEQRGLIVPDTRQTYAIGQLAAIAPKSANNNNDTVESRLRQGRFSRLALANPEFAPYGRAAKQVLQSMNHWQDSESRRVVGENVGQTIQFVLSGHVDMGLVAWSGVLASKAAELASQYDIWLLPQHYYQPLTQQLVVLKSTPEVAQLLHYLNESETQATLKQWGYQLPE